ERRLSEFMNTPLRAINGQMVLTRYKAIADAVKVGRPSGRYASRVTGAGTAELCRRIMSLTFNHGASLEIEGLGANPVRRITQTARKVVQERTGHVPLEKLGDFWRAIDQLPLWGANNRPPADFAHADAVRFILVTGLRKRNGKGVRWEWVDMAARVVRFPA